MKVLQLFIEIILIGSLAILAFNHLYPSSFFLNNFSSLNGISFTFTFIILAWVIGFFINIFADIALNPLYHNIEARWMLREGNPELVLERLRYDLYVRASGKEIIQRIEYHRSLIRLSRCILFIAILYFILALIISSYFQAALSAVIIVFAFFAYHRALIWSIKSTYFAWTSAKQNNRFNSPAQIETSNLLNNNALGKEHYLMTKSMNDLSHNSSLNDSQSGINIVAFTGGTGFRDINMLLAQKTRNITRVVPIWDNGGSSKALRESFDLMPVGDIRHALMTQAHGEGRVGSIVKLFNWRLSDTGNNNELLKELKSFINNQHPLMKSLEPSLGTVIVNYLQRFYESLPLYESNQSADSSKAMNLKNGSIGNFVLVGSYLAHNKDINTAIYVFRQLCSIQGNVWPISNANDLHIDALLENGQIVCGQSETTKIDRALSSSRIKSISFSNNTTRTPSSTPANPMVLDALKKAEVIVFGPGSFFTSVLPQVKVAGVADAISRLDVTKVFIGNLLEDSECYGYTLEELIEIFLTTCNAHASIKRPPNKYITHIIAHSSHTMNEYTHNDRHYLAPGKNIKRFNNNGISIIIDDFENPWKRGGHDPVYISDYLININHT